MKTKKGFTLVELVIVIAVIAILAAVLIPTFAGIIERARESSRLQVVTNARDEFYSANEQIVSPNQMEGYIFVVDEHVYQIVDGQVKNVDLTFTANYVTEQGNEVTGDFISNSEIKIYEPLDNIVVQNGYTVSLSAFGNNFWDDAEKTNTIDSFPEFENCVTVTWKHNSNDFFTLEIIINEGLDSEITIYTDSAGDCQCIETVTFNGVEWSSDNTKTLDSNADITIEFEHVGD